MHVRAVCKSDRYAVFNSLYVFHPASAEEFKLGGKLAVTPYY